ncbi:MAG: spore coat protein [Oscillospiraceae bacterium]|jgi:spore coat protein CotF|nr:spore coat protein [Oscillospiraceae bacterium]
MNSNFSDKDMLTDTLSSIKSATASYNVFANECASNDLRGAYMSILTQEHQSQADVYNEMSSRGWYQTQPAPQDKIQQTKNTFLSQNS